MSFKMETCKKIKEIWQSHKTVSCLITIILIFFFGYFFLKENLKPTYDFLVEDDRKNLELVSMVGGFVLFICTLWTYFRIKQKEQNDFLKLNIDVQYSDSPSSDIIIKTKITNNVNTIKKVKFSCLVISKFYDTSNLENKQEDDNKISSLDFEAKTDFLTKITSLTGCATKVKYTDEIIKLKQFPASCDPKLGIAFLPLPFYYAENVRFGNEEVSYTFLLDHNEIKLMSGKYSVRFFVFRKDRGLHRCVHDAFIIG